MSANASLQDRTISHAVTLERLKPAEVNEVLAQLRRLEKTLVADLQKANLTSFKKTRFEKLLEQSRQTIRATYRTIRDNQQQEMERLAGLESRWAVVSLNQTISEPIGIYLDIAATSFTAQQLKSIANNAVIDSSKASEWWSRQAGNTQRIFSDTVKQGLLRGTPTPEIVRELIGTKVHNYADGALEMSRAHATTLVRSSISAVSADARTATYRANGDLISSLSWLSTLDNKTTLEFCIPRSGKRYTLEDHKPIGHDLPWNGGPGKIHFNCRSQATAVLRPWQEIAGRTLPTSNGETIDRLFREKLRAQGWDEERIAAARRRVQASMSGYVPAELDVQQWLRSQSVAWQNKQLGKGKAALFRSGKITSLAQLLDFRGHPLTLQQVRQQVGGV